MIKLEIILLFLATIYSIYYIGDKIYAKYQRLKNSPGGKNKVRAARKKATVQSIPEKRTVGKTKVESILQETNKKLTLEDREKVKKILKRVELNKMRGYNDKARTLLVEGLTIDKNNRDLNMELASIYEIEEEYQKAEYIYRDMLEKSGNNVEILKRLALSFEKQDKTKDAINIYNKAYNKKTSDIDVIEKLSDLTFEIQDYNQATTYIKLFIKENPRNAEKIAMLGYCEETKGNIKQAIEDYEKALQIQPYNTEIQTRITKLQTKIKS